MRSLRTLFDRVDVSITDWALKMGTSQDQAQVQPIEELVKPREDDVYPLSIHYSQP